MNLTRLRISRIDHDNIDDLVAAGLITPEQAEAITEEFERNLQIAMETKGYATPADLRPIPISEFLRRLSGSKCHAGAGNDDRPRKILKHLAPYTPKGQPLAQIMRGNCP